MLDTVAAVAWTTSSLSSSVVVGIDGVVGESMELESDMVFSRVGERLIGEVGRGQRKNEACQTFNALNCPEVMASSL